MWQRASVSVRRSAVPVSTPRVVLLLLRAAQLLLLLLPPPLRCAVVGLLLRRRLLPRRLPLLLRRRGAALLPHPLALPLLQPPLKAVCLHVHRLLRQRAI